MQAPFVIFLEGQRKDGECSDPSIAHQDLFWHFGRPEKHAFCFVDTLRGQNAIAELDNINARRLEWTIYDFFKRRANSQVLIQA